ncbi:MAG TPA: hypothetical protein VGL20_13675 [Candidatus Dormibacteraeota bacterium]
MTGPIACTTTEQVRATARTMAEAQRRRCYRRCRTLCDDIVERLGALAVEEDAVRAARLASRLRADSDVLLRLATSFNRPEWRALVSRRARLFVVQSGAGVEALVEELGTELSDAESGRPSAQGRALALVMSLHAGVYALTEPLP